MRTKFNQLNWLGYCLGLIMLFLSVIGIQAGTFTDNFATGLDPSYWSVIQTTNNFYLVDTSQDNVQITKSLAHNPGGVQTVYVRLNFAPFGGLITNDFSAQIDFTNAILPGPGLDQVGFNTYYESDSNYDAVYDNSSGYNVHVWDGNTALGTVPVSQNYGTFRITRTNSVVTAYFNDTPLYSETRSSPLIDIDFVLQNNNGSDDATSVTFDNFALASTAVSPVPTHTGPFYFVSLTNVANFSWAAPSPPTFPSEPGGTRLPGAPIGLVTLGGVPFDIASNTNGEQAWNADIAANYGSGQLAITNNVNIYGATMVYSLINTWWGQPGPNAYAWLVFTGSDGASYTKYLVGGTDICDFNHSVWENSINGTTTVNVFSCLSDNWGNPGRLDMQQIALPPEFATQALVSIALVDDGGTNFQRVVLDGLTVRVAPPAVQIPNTNIVETVQWQCTPTISSGSGGYTFGLSNAPTGMTVGSSSGTISWMPTEAQGPSTNTVTFAVSQLGSVVAWTNFTVVVLESNLPPAFANWPGTQSVYANTTLNVPLSANDPDIPVNTLTYATVSAPTGVNINPSSGLLSWTPTTGQVGTSTIYVSVTDDNPWAVNSQHLSVTNSFQVQVLGLTPPSFTQQPTNNVIPFGSAFAFTALATGLPYPQYQWQFSTNGVNWLNLNGGTGTSYSLASSSQTNIGYYRLEAFNSQGTNYSTVADLGFLNLHMYAGLNIDGPIGANYTIQSTPNLNSNWTTLTNITLPTQPYIYIDYTSPTNEMQFYRAMPQD